MLGKKLALAGGVGGTGAAAATATALSTQSTGGEDNAAVDTPQEEEAANTVTQTEQASATTNEVSTTSTVSTPSPATPKTVLDTFKETHWKSTNSNNSYFATGRAIDKVSDFSDSAGSAMTSYADLIKDKVLTAQLSFLNGYSTGNSYKTAKSFLKITTERKNYDGGKWNGSLTWFWSFAHNNKGFVTYNVATTKNKKLVLTGGFYFVERTNTTSNWTVKYKKEIKDTDNKEINKTNFHAIFPKPFWYTSYKVFRKTWWTNWNFIDNADELDKICNADGNTDKCTGSTTNTFSDSATYEWKGDSWYDQKCHYWVHSSWCDHVYNWSADVHSKQKLQWWEHMYGDGKINLKTHLGPFYRGSWKVISDFK